MSPTFAMSKKCSKDGCDGKHYALGLCNKHYLASRYTKEIGRKHRKDTPEIREQARERAAKWYLENMPKGKESRKEYYEKNKERIRLEMKERYALRSEEEQENAIPRINKTELDDTYEKLYGSTPPQLDL